jgi:antitoxin FitA
VTASLCVRAALHSHSMDPEAREILASAVSPQGRVKLGSLLSDMGRHGPAGQTVR